MGKVSDIPKKNNATASTMHSLSHIIHTYCNIKIEDRNETEDLVF